MTARLGVPTPGLRGTYEDSCVVCLRGTDTGLALVGVAEFVVAGHVRLGVPENEAVAMISAATDCKPGVVPVGEFTVLVRVCQECADRTGATVGLIASGRVPYYCRNGGGGGD
jgi:hypothetical protein